MHRHAFAEGGDLRRKPVPAFPLKAFDPVLQCRPGGLIERRNLCLGKPTGERQRREAGAVEDLVGVRVPDAAEEPGIGEGTLEGVVLRAQPLGKAA